MSDNTLHVTGWHGQDASGLVSTGWHVLSGIIDDENIHADAFVDGGLLASATGGLSEDAYPAASIPMQIGGRYSAAGTESLGTPQDLAELVAVPAVLSTADRQKVEGYLAHRWGLSESLPADHPYKSAPPVVEIPEPEATEEATEAVRYRKWLPEQAPAWLQKPNGRAWFWAHGDVMDSLDDLAHVAVLARFPDHTTNDGLSYIGGERGISRGETESASDYASRLKNAWTLWQSSGTPAAILSALRGLGVTNAVLKSEDGRTAAIDASGNVIYTPPRVSSDDDARKIRWVTCPDLWHVFQIFIPYTDGPWENSPMPAADSAEVDALRVAIRRHCGAHAWCDGIVAVNSYGTGGIPRLVDWPERTIEETWEQDETEGAWFDQTPSLDNCPRCLWNVSASGAGETADPQP